MISNFNPSEYVGKWYEAARSQNSFQRWCQYSQTTYELLSDGNIGIVNECTRGEKHHQVKAQAYHEGHGKFVVGMNLFGPFQWIVELFKIGDINYDILDTDYKSYSVVGSPGSGYWWILSRDEKLMNIESHLETLSQNGYDVSTVVRRGEIQ